MRAMVQDEEGWGSIFLNTDQDELETMKEYWEKKYYVDVPENVIEEYEEAWKKVEDVSKLLRDLVEEQGKEVM